MLVWVSRYILSRIVLIRRHGIGRGWIHARVGRHRVFQAQEASSCERERSGGNDSSAGLSSLTGERMLIDSVDNILRSAPRRREGM